MERVLYLVFFIIFCSNLCETLLLIICVYLENIIENLIVLAYTLACHKNLFRIHICTSFERQEIFLCMNACGFCSKNLCTNLHANIRANLCIFLRM